MARKNDYINYIFIELRTCRGVAQLVAHSLWERGVASSSLAIRSIFHLNYNAPSVILFTLWFLDIQVERIRLALMLHIRQ